MAIRPCTRCLHRYRGSSAAVYWALLARGTRLQLREKLCPDCAAEWQTTSLGKLGLEQVTYDNSLYPVLPCAVCGKALKGRTLPLFVVLYAPNQERNDFYGEVCESHEERFEQWFDQIN